MNSIDTPQRTYSDSKMHTSESNQEGLALAIIPEKESNTSQQTLGQDGDFSASDSDEDNFIVALRPEKGLDKLPLRRNPDNGVHSSPSGQGVIFSRLHEKPTVDGYNWRKYGQKLVRGKTLVRSYYKCTSPNCPARKQVERSHDGHITEVKYLRKHEHPKPPHTLLKNEPSLITTEDHLSHDLEASETHLPSTVAASKNFVEVAVSETSEIKSEVNNDIPQESKRLKREGSSVNDSILTKTNCEPRVVVQTTSVVDIVNDGYRWRKYGQKLVKGNPNPRSYYRCSSAGCPVKKHVERASHDEKVVITTYEGQHDHDMLAIGRTVTQNNSGSTSINGHGSSRTQPEEAHGSTGTEMVVHVTSN